MVAGTAMVRSVHTINKYLLMSYLLNGEPVALSGGLYRRPFGPPGGWRCTCPRDATGMGQIGRWQLVAKVGANTQHDTLQLFAVAFEFPSMLPLELIV